MGFKAGTECYADAAGAAAAQCAKVSGVTSAGFVQCVGVTGTAEAPALSLQTVAADGSASSATVAVALQQCDPFEDFGDIAEMWGYAVPAVLAVVLVREFVYRFVMPQ